MQAVQLFFILTCLNNKQQAINMLRQRNIGQGDEVVGESIFIGDVEEPAQSSKYKNIKESKGSGWKYFCLLMIVAAGE